MNEEAATTSECPGQRRRAVIAVVLVCIVCFATLAPFLRIIEFSNGGENAVVASVQEIRRGGPWLFPTLFEEQRTKKPPLATWISAIAARPATMAHFADADSVARDAAFKDFALQVRWPALVAMCGVVIATGVLGTLIANPRVGAVAAAVCSANVFWLQSARLASTDVQLALWVGIANCLLAWGVFTRRWWPSLVGAGAALGLAMMSKGPVALLQSALPVLIFLAWRRWRATDPENAAPASSSVLRPLVTGIVVFLVIGLAWYALVLLKKPEVWAEWKTELSRKGATGLEPSPWYNYTVFFLAMFPWTLFLIVGVVAATTLAFQKSSEAERSDGKYGRIVLALCLTVVPILVMSLFPDRKLRYLTPLLPAAAVLAAWGIIELVGGSVRLFKNSALVAGLHWLPLAVAGVGLPLAASELGPLRTFDGRPWYSLNVAMAAAEAFAVLVLAAMWLQRRRRVLAVAGGTFVIMIAWNIVFNLGYRNYREGHSELRPLAEAILEDYPDAKVYSYRADRPQRHAPIDLSIYLNRNVENVSDPSEMAAKRSGSPRVYMVRQTKPLDDPMSLAPPVGGPWTFFRATPVDKSTWYSFVATK